MLPIPAPLTNPSTSCPLAKLPVIDTVALASVVLSTSVTVSAVLMAAAAPFSA